MTRGVRQVEKDLKDSRALGVQSFSKTPLALRRARVDNAIEVAIFGGLLMAANKETLTESSSAHEREQSERVYRGQKKDKQARGSRGRKSESPKIDGQVLQKILLGLVCGSQSISSTAPRQRRCSPPPISISIQYYGVPRFLITWYITAEVAVNRQYLIEILYHLHRIVEERHYQPVDVSALLRILHQNRFTILLEIVHHGHLLHPMFLY